MNLVIVSAIFLTMSVFQFQHLVKAFSSNSLQNRITLQEPTVSKSVFSLERFLANISLTRSKRSQRALFELPDILELLAVSLSSGDSIYNSINRVITRADGIVASEFRNMIRAIELGASFDEELAAIAERLPQQQVVEFCNKLSLAMRRGTPLAKLLRDQSQSVRSEVQNQIAKQAGKNETRMMIPLVFLILPVTVLFAIYPSLQLLNIQTI